jgi:hypothetical protein
VLVAGRAPSLYDVRRWPGLGCNSGWLLVRLAIVLQQQWEISRRYAMFATPIAYLIDEQGVISHDVAVGTDAILTLIASTAPQPTGEPIAMR